MVKKIKKLPKSYIIASIITIILLIVGFVNPIAFPKNIEEINQFLFKIFGNFYLWFAYIALFLCLAIGFSPLGKIKIGGEKAKPDYNMFSWFSMLFCAGMGVGIFFWGGAEPLMHYMNPFLQGAGTPLQNEVNAFQMAFFHWCFHPWAIYGLTTLLICFFSMNLKKGIHFSSFFITCEENESMLRRIIKSFVNNLTTLAILFGIVVSFGFGVIHFESGLNSLFNIEPSNMIKISIIVGITVCYMISTLRGLNNGIKILSNISMILSFILLGCIALFVPFENLITPIVKSIPHYLANINNLSLGHLPFKEDSFLNVWTIKYWAWWVAWAPFVGIFVALISKGRTVRQLIFGMLLIPSVYTILAFTILGEAAIYLQNTHNIVGSTFVYNEAGSVLYQICLTLFHSPYLAWLALLIIGIYFINSADSATYTLAAISQKPKASVKISEDEVEIKTPPAYLQICWGLTFSILAGLFLFLGGLQIIEKTLLIAVLPFTFLLCIAFVKMTIDMISYYKKKYIVPKKNKIKFSDESLSIRVLQEEKIKS